MKEIKGFNEVKTLKYFLSYKVAKNVITHVHQPLLSL